MKKTIRTILVLLLLSLAACNDDKEEIFTSATINLEAADSIKIQKIQGTAKAVNINTRQITTNSQFDNLSSSMKLLRGAYQITINGYVVYLDNKGTLHTHAFIAYTDYCEFKDIESETKLKIVLI